jgi:acyl carrier protein
MGPTMSADVDGAESWQPAAAEELDAVRDAFAFVCELDAASLSADTRLDDINADSLVRVAVADLIEARLWADDAGWRIDDTALGRVATLGELAQVVVELSRSAPPMSQALR